MPRAERPRDDGGGKLFTLRCESCGAPVEVGGPVTDFRCDYCGSLLAPNHEATKRAAVLEEAARRRELELARQAQEEAQRQAAIDAEKRAQEAQKTAALGGLVGFLGSVYLLYLGPALVLQSRSRYPEFFPDQFKSMMGDVAWFPVANVIYVVLSPLFLLGVLIVGGLKAVGILLSWLIWWAAVGLAAFVFALSKAE